MDRPVQCVLLLDFFDMMSLMMCLYALSAGVTYACQAHTSILPNGARQGFYIGDSTGVCD